jgi:hypothetical protein
MWRPYLRVVAQEAGHVLHVPSSRGGAASRTPRAASSLRTAASGRCRTATPACPRTPLKQTLYPPNGTFFGGLAFPFALAFAIVSSLPSVVGIIVSVAVRSFRAPSIVPEWRRPPARTEQPPGNQDQRAARFRRDSADFLPAARAAARFSADVTPHRTHTYDAGLTILIGHRFSPQEAQTTSKVLGCAWTGQPQVGQAAAGPVTILLADFTGCAPRRCRRRSRTSPGPASGPSQASGPTASSGPSAPSPSTPSPGPRPRGSAPRRRARPARTRA